MQDVCHVVERLWLLVLVLDRSLGVGQVFVWVFGLGVAVAWWCRAVLLGLGKV